MTTALGNSECRSVPFDGLPPQTTDSRCSTGRQSDVVDTTASAWERKRSAQAGRQRVLLAQAWSILFPPQS